MKDVIFYKLLNMNIIRKGFSDTRIEELLKLWLNENNIDAVVLVFNIETNYASLSIDYSFDKNKNVSKIQKLTEMFLDKLYIEYEVEVE